MSADAEYVIGNDVDTRINCQLTSTTGCVSILSLYVTTDESTLDNIEDVTYDTICTGIAYENQYYDLPPQMREGDYAFPNSIYTMDESGCTQEMDIMLYLSVMEHETTINDAICEGLDYDRNGFHITAEQIEQLMQNDPFHSENPVFTFVNEVNRYGNCQQIVTLHLTISDPLILPEAILGPTDVCTGEDMNYVISDAGNLTNFTWLAPTGANIVSGQGEPEVTINFRDGAPDEATLTLHGSNGCGASDLPLTIHTHPVIYNFINDTICSGNNYTGHGFELTRQDSAGTFSFANQGQTNWGCDSIAVLNLTVGQTPNLTMTTTPETPMLCPGEELTINSTDLIMIPPEIILGDILCSDTTFYAAEDWPIALMEGKTPLGVVFYVDSTGHHGWAVALGEANVNSCNWSRTAENMLGSVSPERSAICYFNGEQNTNTISNYFGNVIPSIPDYGNYPAFAVAYYYEHVSNMVHTAPHGWFLPSAGQLRVLFSNLNEVKNSLDILSNMGIDVDTFDGTGYGSSYWSSTASSSTNAWTVSKDGELKSDPKQSGAHRVRSIRVF